MYSGDFNHENSLLFAAAKEMTVVLMYFPDQENSEELFELYA